MTCQLQSTFISFLVLPTEIRLIILELLLVPKFRLLTFDICDQEQNNVSPQILQTCRQLLAEGVPLLYSRSTIRAQFSCDKSEKLFTKINRMNIRWIRKLDVPADDDIDDIDEARDLVRGARNFRLGELLQDYPELENLQMLSLRLFEQEFPPSWDDWDPYFEKLDLWEKYEVADAKRKEELNEMAVQYAFRWTVLRAVASVDEHRPELRNVYERTDGGWSIVFTRIPVQKAGSAASDFPFGNRSRKFTTLEVDVDKMTVVRGQVHRVHPSA